MRLSQLPPSLAAETGPALQLAATTGEPSSCSGLIFRDEDQGCAPSWYPAPGIALLAGNEYLVLD